MLWHWHVGHLGAALENQEALRVHEIYEKFRVGSHDWEEPVASVACGFSWNEESNTCQFSRHLFGEGNFVRVILLSVGSCALDDLIQDSSTWLHPELAEEVVSCSESSHELHKLLFKALVKHFNSTFDYISVDIYHVDLPN